MTPVDIYYLLTIFIKTCDVFTIIFDFCTCVVNFLHCEDFPLKMAVLANFSIFILILILPCVFASNYYTSSYELQILFEKEITFTNKLKDLMKEYRALKKDLPRARIVLGE